MRAFTVPRFVWRADITVSAFSKPVTAVSKKNATPFAAAFSAKAMVTLKGEAIPE